MSDATPPRTTGATEKVRGVNGQMVTKKDYDFTTNCAQMAWQEMVEFYGPDGIEEIRRGLSQRGVRRFTASVLNAVLAQGYSIVPDTLLDAVEAVVDDHHDAGEFAGVPLGKMQDLRDRWDAYKQERS